MIATTALLALTLTAAAGEPAADCGLSPVALPDFSLVDMNTHSPTYKQSVSLDDHAGEVVVIYWAYAP
mgnify:CR=1 FL=1